jgi:hypothetical protein
MANFFTAAAVLQSRKVAGTAAPPVVPPQIPP